MPTEQLPAIIPSGGLTTTTDTYVVPVLIARAGDQTTTVVHTHSSRGRRAAQPTF
jgi:hypothetical protein